MAQLSGRPAKQFSILISETQFYIALVNEDGSEEVIALSSSISTMEAALSQMMKLSGKADLKFDIKDLQI